MNYDYLQQWIRTHRLTKEQFANAIGIHRSTFYRKLSTGEPVSSVNVLNAIRAYGLKPDEVVAMFFGGTPPRDEPEQIAVEDEPLLLTMISAGLQASKLLEKYRGESK